MWVHVDGRDAGMTDVPRSVEAFRAQAEHYDRDAELLMGDRIWQRQYLTDLLSCMRHAPHTFVDLACGTGYFTEVSGSHEATHVNNDTLVGGCASQVEEPVGYGSSLPARFGTLESSV
jgi:hypothetical protein